MQNVFDHPLRARAGQQNLNPRRTPPGADESENLQNAPASVCRTPAIKVVAGVKKLQIKSEAGVPEG